MLKIIIIGNLTADPETRYVDTASGQQNVCNFTVAVNRVHRDQKTTNYYRISCWNRQADNAAKYLHKGSKVAVTGSVITARTYTDRNGETRVSMEVPADDIEYLSRSDNSQTETGQQQRPQPTPATDENEFMNIPEGMDEELPFN